MKKLLALLLSLTCVFALAFTACGDKPDDNPDDTQNEQPNGENNEDQTSGGNNNEDETTHTHNFETSWTYNGATHWHKATCHPDEKKDEAPHNYVDGICQTCRRAELYEVGNMLPDFTVDIFSGDSFSSESARGKVLVINFWYVNCGPCIAEIPEMEKVVSENYSDDVIMIALHSSGSAHAGDLAVAPTFVNNKGWSNYGMIFGKDNANEDLYRKCGGDGYYPLTVILNGEGEITFIHSGYLMYYDIQTMTDVDLFTPAIEEALGN